MSGNIANPIKVLDCGLVRLVDSMGSDLSIARSARISHDAAWRAGEDKGSDSRLINFLYDNGHNAPFESVTFTFEIKAPIFVIRQWHRHRTQSYNEVSARYTELPEEFYVPEPHLVGRQNVKNKQVRDIITKEEFDNLPAEDAHKQHTYLLPVSTYTHMFATMNLHNLFKFLSERLHTHAQYEIRVYAEAMLKLIEPIVPVAVKAFKQSLEK